MINKETGAGFSIIIPTFNEAAVIRSSIERTHGVWPDAEIVVVDDGSSDNTVDVVEQLNARYVRLHFYPKNRGKGYAIARGIELVQSPFSLQLDADCQFPPEAMPELVTPLIDGNARVVFCSRYCTGASRESGSVSTVKRLASLLASGLVSLLARQRLTDVFAGFKAWDSNFIKALDIKESGFGYEAEIALKASRRGEKISEIPIVYAARRGGNSKIRLSRDLVEVPLSIMKVWLSL